MSYDIQPVKAPRAAGGLLKILCLVMENPLTGALLSRKLLAQVGIMELRGTPCDDPPWPLEEKRGKDPVPKFDREALAGRAGTLPHIPPDDSFRFAAAADYVKAYKEGRTDPVAVARRILHATSESEDLSPPMRAFIAQDETDVSTLAAASTERYRAGRPLGPLDGVPVAVKDEVDQSPYPTTVGTRFLGLEPAVGDACLVERLRAAGALFIGKTNMHEIGLGVTGVNPHHGAARNPYNPGHATGGSSSGPAAALAMGLCPLAIGADGGGSIRIPSSFCGVVGLKPTFGRMSERGAAPLCWSVAHVGPMGATVGDVALGYALMAGPDPADENSLHQPAPHLADLENADLTGVRIGLPRQWFEDADDEVVAACRTTLSTLESAGAVIQDVDIPELALLRAVHLVTIVTEMAAAHVGHYAVHRREYGLDTRMNLALARCLSAYDYAHAQRLRTRICGHFDRVLDQVDVLATPATGRTAPVIPRDSLATGESNLPMTTRIMLFAPAANLTGLPAVSFPAGYDGAGLPVGFQIMGRHWDESLLLRMAAVAERHTVRRPPKVHFDLLQDP